MTVQLKPDWEVASILKASVNMGSPSWVGVPPDGPVIKRLRIAFRDVQVLLGTNFFFDFVPDDTITTEDGKPALLLINDHETRGKEDPTAFTLRVNVARHVENYGDAPPAAQLRANALHEILHAFRGPADKLGTYRLRVPEHNAYLEALEAAAYAEERAFAPLVNYWFSPWYRRMWRAFVGKPKALDTL